MYLFRERLKDLRDELNLDQKEMGERLNLSASAYGYYEQGRNEPSLQTLIKIAQTFNVTTDYLLGLTNTRETSVYYKMSDKILLSNSEMDAIQKMKELPLLEEVSEDPSEYVVRLNRYWQFIKNERDNK
ncbi:helix-turn-helix domain-containing protein [Pseudogracilibacillus auburnensis]|uniref:helix-turn-helix domain-containing protein n=1 Tax=Pseudogracilibacillus auburnensis TaxID=1494959 RepID=UPI001A96B9AE|nr:helix-turn-helix transcriptional regulator [Pseudogracilibacillus auburnensis]MBO1003177.1 helix-turn-helix transcriptional regulator [Pseudogracilibacillus auburnensis]